MSVVDMLESSLFSSTVLSISQNLSFATFSSFCGARPPILSHVSRVVLDRPRGYSLDIAAKNYLKSILSGVCPGGHSFKIDFF